MKLLEKLKINCDFIDLTHSLSPSVPLWEGGCGFSHRILIDYLDCTTETKFRVQQMTLHAGVGTHMDAPAHCIPGGAFVGDIPVSQLIGPCVVMDVSSLSHANYLLSVEEILKFEEQQGALKPGDIFLVHTGWGKKWNDPDQYRNGLEFPSISEEAALLLKERKVAAVGIDTLGVDQPSSGYPAHRILLGVGIILIENVANILQMPTRGGVIFCLPLKAVDLTEAPVRLIGLKEKR